MKERDALKRAAAAAAAAGSGAAPDGPDARRLEAELKKKDELVTQVSDVTQVMPTTVMLTCGLSCCSCDGCD
jgi:hypothetical protein